MTGFLRPFARKTFCQLSWSPEPRNLFPRLIHPQTYFAESHWRPFLEFIRDATDIRRQGPQEPNKGTIDVRISNTSFNLQPKVFCARQVLRTSPCVEASAPFGHGPQLLGGLGGLGLRSTSTHQNLVCCRVTKKFHIWVDNKNLQKVGFGR